MQWIEIDITNIPNLQNKFFLRKIVLINNYYTDYNNSFTFKYVEKPKFVIDSVMEINDMSLYLDIEYGFSENGYGYDYFTQVIDLFRTVIDRIRHEKLKVIEEL